MQKKIIALAIAGLASSAAFAQSNVTIYGLLDYGFVTRADHNGATQPADNGRRSELASGIGAGSRIGFKGSEDLGNGLKAVFELEYGISIDNAGFGGSTTPFWNRHSWVGLTGNFGTVIGGRVDGARYSWINKYDPFAGGTVASAVTVFNEQVSRADNALVYITPNFSGFSGLFAYTNGLIGNESAGTAAHPHQNAGDIRLWVATGMYDNGPISALINFEGASRKEVDNSDIHIFDIGGSYDFGIVKVSALYDRLKDDLANSAPSSLATGDVRNWLVGVSVPFAGNWLARANYVNHDDRSDLNQDCNKYGVGVKYSLSKRTYVAADYAHIRNKGDTGTCMIGFSGTAGAADFPQTSTSLFGVSGYDVFISHSF